MYNRIGILGYKDACFELMKLCAENVFEGFIAFHSLSIIWYVIKKQESEGKARAWLNNICDMLTVTGATQEQIKEAIKNANFLIILSAASLKAKTL